MASAFSDSLMASGKHPSLRSRYDRGMKVWLWNFYHLLVSIWRHKIKKEFDISGLICKLRTKIPKIPIFGNATSKHAYFTKFCRIVHIVRNDPSKFQIDISKIGYFTEQCRTAHKIRTMTSSNLLGDVMSSISRHWPRFKSFWQVELKLAFHKCQPRAWTKFS